MLLTASEHIGETLTGGLFRRGPFADPSTNFAGRDRKATRFTQELRCASPQDAETGWTIWADRAVYYSETADYVQDSSMPLLGPTLSGRNTYALTTTRGTLFGEIAYPSILSPVRLDSARLGLHRG